MYVFVILGAYRTSFEWGSGQIWWKCRLLFNYCTKKISKELFLFLINENLLTHCWICCLEKWRGVETPPTTPIGRPLRQISAVSVLSEIVLALNNLCWIKCWLVGSLIHTSGDRLDIAWLFSGDSAYFDIILVWATIIYKYVPSFIEDNIFCKRRTECYGTENGFKFVSTYLGRNDSISNFRGC